MFKKKGDKEDLGFFGRNKLAMTIATLMGTIIGAGILGIPYVVAKTGFVYVKCEVVYQTQCCV